MGHFLASERQLTTVVQGLCCAHSRCAIRWAHAKRGFRLSDESGGSCSACPFNNLRRTWQRPGDGCSPARFYQRFTSLRTSRRASYRSCVTSARASRTSCCRPEALDAFGTLRLVESVARARTICGREEECMVGSEQPADTGECVQCIALAAFSFFIGAATLIHLTSRITEPAQLRIELLRIFRRLRGRADSDQRDKHQGALERAAHDAADYLKTPASRLPTSAPPALPT